MNSDLDRLRKAAERIHDGRGQQLTERAAQSTIDALMYSTRLGVGVLKRADVRQRLARLDEAQTHACGKQLAHRNPEVAKSWTVAEVEAFVAAWVRCHG